MQQSTLININLNDMNHNRRTALERSVINYLNHNRRTALERSVINYLRLRKIEYFQFNCSVLTFNYFLLPLIRQFCGDKHLAAAVHFRFECETLKNKQKKIKKQLDGIRFFCKFTK